MKINKLLDKYSIKYKNIEVYELARVHPSYQNENSLGENNQRLEFLGDAVLELIVSKEIYRRESLSEGDLSMLRAALVCEKSLAKLARKLGLEEFLLLGRGEELIGGRKRDSNLADFFEAFIGALFLDLGYLEAEAFFLENFLEDIKDTESSGSFIDYKSKLQILIQKKKKVVEYKLVESSGPDHRRSFLVACLVDGKELGQGRANSIREAQQRAAREALDVL